MTANPTYVLVHGAWSGAWAWRDVGGELTRRGVPWVALDLPSSTHGAPATTYLADDAQEVIQVANLEGPVVLVGHSYGGAVITEAADKVHDLIGLVYVAAMVPELGQSTNEAKAEVDVRTLLDETIRRGDDFLTLEPTMARAALFNQCSADVAAWATAQLSTQTLASFRSPRSAFSTDAPSRFILCDNDQALDPTLQLVMAQRCDRVTSIHSDHSPFFSNVGLLCDLMTSETN